MESNAVREPVVTLEQGMAVESAIRRVQAAIRTLDPVHRSDERIDDAVSLLVRAMLALEEAQPSPFG